MKTIWLALYGFVLRTFGLAERRCAYCKKLMGYKYGPAFRRRFGKDQFAQTHGICEPCNAVYFPEPVPVSITARRPRRQYLSRKNLRRTTGGWSGAVAVR
jgi:hypothetical protein